MNNIKFMLPFPPSNNTYYRKFKNRMVLSDKGKEYKKEVYFNLHNQKLTNLNLKEELKIIYIFYVPDLRKRDIDNMFKGLNDSLMNAKVFIDDSQIIEIYAKKVQKKEHKFKKGAVKIDIFQRNLKKVLAKQNY